LPPNTTPIGQAPIVPAIAPFTRIGVAMTSGIYGFNPATQQLAEVYHSQRALANIRAADIDDDGDIDLVASGDRDVALDILYRIPPFPGFQPFLFNTDSPVLDFQIGDFDGNEKLDIAYVESRTFDERLFIAYGTADQLLPGALVGSFAHVLSIILADFPDSIDPFRRITDLAVLFESERGSPESSLTLLHGSPQRTMLAFFDPREPPPDPGSTFRGIVTGRFGGAGNNDLVAIEVALDPNGVGLPKRTSLWLSLGAMGGDLMMNQIAITAPEMSECTLADRDAAGPFCLNGAHYVAWPASTTADLVIGIDAKREMIAFEPSMFVLGGSAQIARFPDRMVGPPDTVVRNVHVIEVEDGTPRLVIGRGPGPDAANPRMAAAVNVCTFDLAAGPTCRDVGEAVAAVEQGAVACIDAGYAHVAAASRFVPPDTNEKELLVVCRREAGPDRLYRVSVDLARVIPMFDLGGADALQIGDVTGDGIDDLIVVDRNFAVPVMRVFRQCNSRDVDCGVADSSVGAGS
jgi:hypothetical protein